jgi:hypothetical protein
VAGGAASAARGRTWPETAPMTPTTSGRMQRRTGLSRRAFPLQQAGVKFAARRR